MVSSCQIPEPQCIFTRNHQAAFLLQKGCAKGNGIPYFLPLPESADEHKVKGRIRLSRLRPRLKAICDIAVSLVALLIYGQVSSASSMTVT